MIVTGHGLSLLTSARRALLPRLLLILARRGCYCYLLLMMSMNFARHGLLLCGGVRSMALYEHWRPATQAGVECPADLQLVWAVLSSVLALRTCTRHTQHQHKAPTLEPRGGHLKQQRAGADF